MTGKYKDYEIVQTSDFKLKAKAGENVRIVDLENDFGEMPEVIAVERVIGKKNLFRLRGFVNKKIITK